jgi:hypothetical protein
MNKTTINLYTLYIMYYCIFDLYLFNNFNDIII